MKKGFEKIGFKPPCYPKAMDSSWREQRLQNQRSSCVHREQNLAIVCLFVCFFVCLWGDRWECVIVRGCIQKFLNWVITK